MQTGFGFIVGHIIILPVLCDSLHRWCEGVREFIFFVFIFVVVFFPRYQFSVNRVSVISWIWYRGRVKFYGVPGPRPSTGGENEFSTKKVGRRLFFRKNNGGGSDDFFQANFSDMRNLVTKILPIKILDLNP